MKEATYINSYNTNPQKGVSWRAIFAGTITVLSIVLVLNLIGLAIGLSTIEPTEESNPLSGLGTGTIIWWILSNLIALFAGGFVAARVGVSFATKSGVIQGVMTWALWTLISAWMVTSLIGSIISGVGNLVGNVLSTTGQVVGQQVAPAIQSQLEDVDISWEQARAEFRSLLRDTGQEELDPDRLEQDATRYSQQAQGGQEIDEVFDRARNRMQESYEALDREALVNILMERTEMNRAEAERNVDTMIGRYENLRARTNEFLANARETANRHAENVAKAAAEAALYLSIALILGVLAAGFGGFLGVQNLREDYERELVVREDNEHVYRKDEF